MCSGKRHHDPVETAYEMMASSRALDLVIALHLAGLDQRDQVTLSRGASLVREALEEKTRERETPPRGGASSAHALLVARLVSVASVEEMRVAVTYLEALSGDEPATVGEDHDVTRDILSRACRARGREQRPCVRPTVALP